MKIENDVIQNMYAGSQKEIIAGVQSETAILIMNAIIAGVQCGIRDEKFIQGLHKATKNDTALLNVAIKDVAVAGLDVLGIEKYQGDDEKIKEYISGAFKNSGK